MVIIVGLAFGMGVLWLWLSGHWFGRVLAFLCFGGVALVVAAVMSGFSKEAGVFIAVMAAMAGLPCAWLLADLPMGVARRKYAARVKRMDELLHPDPRLYKPAPTYPRLPVNQSVPGAGR